MSPVPEPQCPMTSRPVRSPVACSASQASSSPGSRIVPTSSKPPSVLTSSSFGSASSSRSRSTRNSSPSNSWWVASRFHGRRRKSSMPSGRSRSRTRALICRLRSTSSIRSWNASAALPFSSPAWAARFSSPPYCSSHLAAVFGPTPGTAGQVVAGLPHQRGQLRIARRGWRSTSPRPPPGVIRARSETPLPRIEHGDVVGHQLERVPVAGADQHVEAGRLGLGRERPDHVVGLEPRLLDEGDVEGVEHLLDQVELALELVRGLGAVGLVLGVDLGSERLPGHVEGHREMGRRLVAQHVDQHRGEAEDAVGVLAGLGGEVLHRQREERPVRDRVAVDQQQLGTGWRAGGRHNVDSIRDH